MSWFLDGNLSGRSLSQYAAKEIDYWMRADGSALGLSMAKSEEGEKLAYHRAAAAFAARAVFQAAKNSVDGNQSINEEYLDDAAMCAALARGYQTAAQGAAEIDGFLSERRWQVERFEEMLTNAHR